MAPKKEPKVDKAKLAAKQKAAEDKTFGLKNKNKSSKVQQYVQNVKKNATQVGNALKTARAEGPTLKEVMAAKKAAEKELAALTQVAIKQPKVPEGVDPKSIVCEFFRHGQCTKGSKCKFAHDLSVERKSHKIDLFTDQRNVGKDGEEGEGKGMEDWDQETLERAVKEKHANENKNRATEIICKFFLEAVERRLYGWFWKCPNGDACKYRHALPPGYLLKSQMKELLEEEARNAKDASEMIEEERRRLDARTPINEDVFRAWRAAKIEAKRKAREEADADRRKKGMLNGREIFQQEGFVAEDDNAAADDDEYGMEDDDEAKIREMLEAAQRAAVEARTKAAEALANGELIGPAQDESEDLHDAYAEYEDGDNDNSGGESSGQGQDDDGGEGSGAGPSGSGGNKVAATTTTLRLGKEEGEELFGDDDDDDEELELDDDDDDEDDLEGLEAHVKGLHT